MECLLPGSLSCLKVAFSRGYFVSDFDWDLSLTVWTTEQLRVVAFPTHWVSWFSKKSYELRSLRLESWDLGLF